MEAARVGSVNDVGDPPDSDSYRIRLDGIELLEWAAVRDEQRGGPDGYWIAVRLIVGHSWEPSGFDALWLPLNDGVETIALFFQAGDIGGEGPLYRVNDEQHDYKVQFFDLPDAGLIDIPGTDDDGLASLAACLGEDPAGYGSSVPWTWNAAWFEASADPWATPAPGITLRADGIGFVVFGDAVEEAPAKLEATVVEMLPEAGGWPFGSPAEIDPGTCNQRQLGWFPVLLVGADQVTGRVGGYSTDRSELLTPEGVGVGSSLAEVQAIYPGGVVTLDPRREYSAGGYRFWITGDGLVGRIEAGDFCWEY